MREILTLGVEPGSVRIAPVVIRFPTGRFEKKRPASRKLLDPSVDVNTAAPETHLRTASRPLPLRKRYAITAHRLKASRPLGAR